MNSKFVQKILKWLGQQGVLDIVICPGGRNAPFVAELEKAKPFNIQSFYDERSAGFFALGRAQRDQRPVAVITTSGTAVTELISSAVEATYTETPLIFITADRPRKLRGTGAPQVIDQKNIFSSHAETSYDFEVGESFEVNWTGQKPLHINVCFDEPLIDVSPVEKDYEVSDFNKPIKPSPQQIKLPRPLIVLSGMTNEESAHVEQLLSHWSGPIYAEPLSSLKNSTRLKPHLILSGSSMVKRMLDDGFVESVLRIGDVPVGRFWRDLEESSVKVISVSSKNYQGLSHGEIIYTDIVKLSKEHLDLENLDWSSYKEEDSERENKVKSLIETYPQSEVGLFQSISDQMEEGDEIYLGNSLPIRIWDLVKTQSAKPYASRGVNGIDGQVSTAFGHVREGKTFWIVLGDLTTMYDFSGFWATPMLKELKAKVNFVVVNNKGGQIFSRIFDSSLFLNSHDRNFRKMAEFWGWNYFNNPQSFQFSENLNFIEINPSPEETEKFWLELDKK